jgi:predicted ATPase
MFLKAISLENVKGFQKLSFDFQRPDHTYAGWTVFVGGNSSGKSALLKAAALALMGPEAGRQLLGTTKGWIYKDLLRADIHASIAWDQELDRLKGGGKPPGEFFDASVRWQREKAVDDVPVFRPAPLPKNKRVTSADRGPWNQNASGWFSAGYGPMRRLSGSSSESIRYTVGGGIIARYVTLFREDAALSESEEWLRKMHSRSLEAGREDQAEIESLLKGVIALLGDGLLPHGMRISRVTVDNVFVTDDRKLELPMRDISDGCRSVYATVLDLVHGMYEVYGGDSLFAKNTDGLSVVARPGIVIIDEIEAHLHPAWQRDIPSWLKTHFPSVQFLVSTHSPLVAQAADPNGIFVLPLQDEAEREPRALTDEEYEKIRWGRAEKTLLGVAFGLKSTRSRWANKQIERYQRLNAKKKAKAELSPNEKKIYEELHGQLQMVFEPVSELEG